MAAAPYELDDPRLLPNARAPRIIVASGIHADETPGMYTRSRLPRARAGQGPGALPARATFRKVCVKLWWEAETRLQTPTSRQGWVVAWGRCSQLGEAQRECFWCPLP